MSGGASISGERRGLGAWWRAHRRRLCELWVVGVLASLGVTLASAVGYLDTAQATVLDLFMRLQRYEPIADVVIVAIDDDAFEALGQRQPLSREYLAAIVRGLARAGAAVVGLDVSLSVRTADDAPLASAMLEFADGGVSRVVTVSGSPPDGPLANVALVSRMVSGSPEVQEDSDCVIRRAKLATRTGSHIDPSFALAVVARLQGLDRRTLDELLQRPGGRIELPMWRRDEKGKRALPLAIAPDVSWRINFAGPRATFLTIPSRAIAELAKPGVEVERDNPLRGRIVLVGATFAESRDFYATPHGRLAGVEIHANLVHMLGTRTFIQPSGWLVGLALQILLVVGAGALLVLLHPFVGTMAALAGAVLIGLPASYLIFARAHHWIDFMLPVAAMRLMAWGVDVLDRRDVREALERYVSPGKARQIAKEEEPLHGDRRPVTLLHVTLRDFAQQAETLSPADVTASLSAYRDVVRKAVFDSDGMVHVGIDDGVLAVFGAPTPHANHAVRGARAARAIEAGIRQLNARRATDGAAALRVRIVIHSGTVVAGNVGAAGQLTYSVVGAAARVVAQLDGLNDGSNTPILITASVREALPDTVALRDLGAVALRGDGAIQLYELVDTEADTDER